MKMKGTLKSCAVAFSILLTGYCACAGSQESAEFADKVVAAHGLSGAGAAKLRALLLNTPQLTRNIGTEDPDATQGPNNSWHPASRAQCAEKALQTGLIAPNPGFERICGAKWMSPIPDYAGQPLDQASVCIDQFEFPDIPCEYPVAWVTAPIAQKICASMGKRICDSGEWEGGCAGAMDERNGYYFGESSDAARKDHNDRRVAIWAYQFIESLRAARDTRATCGVFSPADPDISQPMRSDIGKYYAPAGQSKGCDPAGNPYATCGTNTWPAGFKLECRSPLDVFDMHGNVAETTNLPSDPSQLASSAGGPGGLTEHKGSFFVYRPQYPDDCRVRQPYEHAGPFQKNGMAFYQEGFRCCKSAR
jgi:hypothetical protein